LLGQKRTSASATIANVAFFFEIIGGGILPETIITGKGPFSADENRSTIRNFRIGILVTKDSGKVGGVSEKLEAARLEGCRVVVARRPEPPGEYFDQVEPS